MKRSLKVYLDLEQTETLVLQHTFETLSEIFNEHIEWAFENKSYSKKKAHNEIYHLLHQKYADVPTALIQNVRDTALESVKTLKFKFKPKKKKTSCIRYDARTLRLKNDNTLSFSTIDKRIKTKLNFSKYHLNIIKIASKRCNGVNIGYDKKKKKFYVILIYEFQDNEARNEGEIIGIDRGIKNLLTLSNGKFLGNEIKKSKRKYSYLRQKLSIKGTRSSKRLLKRLSGRERRFNREINHKLSKMLASNENVSTYVLEDLKNIRKDNKKSKNFNRMLHSWPFCQFEMFLNYKCVANGIKVEKVSAKYTSQTCNVCGCRNKKNRNRSTFCCTKCGHKDHADINAAKNIATRYLTSLLKESEAGSVSMTQSKCENISMTVESVKSFMSKISL